MKTPKRQFAGLSLITGIVLASLSGCQKETQKPYDKENQGTIGCPLQVGKAYNNKVDSCQSLPAKEKNLGNVGASGDSTNASGGDGGGPQFPPH